MARRVIAKLARWVVGAACLCLGAHTALAQPQNDPCGQARAQFALPAAGGSVTGDMTGATRDAASTSCPATQTGADVYWYITPTASGTFVFDTCTGTGFDSVLSIYTDTCPVSTATEVAGGCNDDACGLQSRITVALQAGTNYILRMGGFSSSTAIGPYTITVTVQQPITNDDCGANNPLLTLNTPITGSNAGANTTITVTPNTLCGAATFAGGAADLFYRFIPSSSGTHTFSMCGSSFDTVLSIHSACPVTSANVLGCNDDAGSSLCSSNTLNSVVIVPGLVAGQTYYVRVAGYNGATGSFSIVVNEGGTVIVTGACCVGTTCSVVQTGTCGGNYIGDNTTCGTNPCGATTGACCNSSTCTVTTQAGCSFVYRGNGTVCSPNPCTSTTIGACCVGVACTQTLQTACAGSFRGVGTTCTPNPCDTRPRGACCQATGGCVIGLGADCAGVFLGNNTVCTASAFGDTPCSGDPAGACCERGNGCRYTSQSDCLGIFRGPGLSCGAQPCTGDPVGGCCFADGGCLQLTQAECTAASGTYQGDFTVCGQGTNCVAQAFAACCAPNGACTLVTGYVCTQTSGTISTTSNTCDPNNCPLPTGACCTAATGACAVSTQAACPTGNTYLGSGTTCTPTNPCPQPTGACCSPSLGTCTVSTQALCTTPNNYQGNLTTCTPTNPCPQPPTGACCVTASGACSVTIQANCTTGRTWQLNGQCTPTNPCPQPPFGACCLSEGTCLFILARDCAGNFLGVGRTCTPTNPCPAPVGACCSAGGVCTQLTVTACTGGGGTFRGVGVDCLPQPCPQPFVVCCRGATCTTGMTAAQCVSPAPGIVAYVGSTSPTGVCNATGTFTTPCCYGNFDKSADGVQVADIFAYLSAWFGNSPYAIVGRSTTGGAAPTGVPQVADIFSFLSAWFGGGCS